MPQPPPLTTYHPASSTASEHLPPLQQGGLIPDLELPELAIACSVGRYYTSSFGMIYNPKVTLALEHPVSGTPVLSSKGINAWALKDNSWFSLD